MATVGLSNKFTTNREARKRSLRQYADPYMSHSKAVMFVLDMHTLSRRLARVTSPTAVGR